MSTLHTNDAPTTLTRLLNMGVAPFNIASAVLLITAQRLARRLCENCKAPADYPREAMLKAGFQEGDLDGSWKPYRAVGCSACSNGYKGRVGIYQVMPISERSAPHPRRRHGDGSGRAGHKEGVRDLRRPASSRSGRRDDAGRNLGDQRIVRHQRWAGRTWPTSMATAAAIKERQDQVFEWEGKDKNGKIVRGEMRAGGEAMVSASLRRQGILTTRSRSAAPAAAKPSSRRTSPSSRASWPP